MCRSSRFCVLIVNDAQMYSAKRRFLPFLCIAQRVTGHGVNSNLFI